MRRDADGAAPLAFGFAVVDLDCLGNEGADADVFVADGADADADAEVDADDVFTAAAPARERPLAVAALTDREVRLLGDDDGDGAGSDDDAGAAFRGESFAAFDCTVREEGAVCARAARRLPPVFCRFGDCDSVCRSALLFGARALTAGRSGCFVPLADAAAAAAAADATADADTDADDDEMFNAAAVAAFRVDVDRRCFETVASSNLSCNDRGFPFRLLDPPTLWTLL